MWTVDVGSVILQAVSIALILAAACRPQRCRQAWRQGNILQRVVVTGVILCVSAAQVVEVNKTPWPKASHMFPYTRFAMFAMPDTRRVIENFEFYAEDHSGARQRVNVYHLFPSLNTNFFTLTLDLGYGLQNDSQRVVASRYTDAWFHAIARRMAQEGQKMPARLLFVEEDIDLSRSPEDNPIRTTVLASFTPEP